MKYVKFDSNGKLVARYDTEIHGSFTITVGDSEVANPDCKIPFDAIPVSDEIFARSINESDGEWMINSASGVITKQPFNPESIASIKARYKTQIDQVCGNKRASILSSGDYIAEEYRRAYDVSVVYKAAGYPATVPASVQSWATADAITARAAADSIIATRDAYMALLDTIRDIRLKAKAVVDAASSQADILSAVDTVNAALANI